MVGRCSMHRGLSPGVVCFGGSCGSGECETLPDHLEDIVTGSHPSLGEAGRSLLRNLPAVGEPVTAY